MRVLCLVAAIALLSCENKICECDELTSTEEVEEITDHENNFQFKEVWICHHPGTNFHNRRCIADEFPDGCYVSGDTGKFCWLMFENDCKNPENREIAAACLNIGYDR